MIKIGIIGHGFMGHEHETMLSRLEGYQLVGFSDRDRSVLEDVRPGLKRYESNEALLRDPEVDTVLIAANNNQHHDLVVQAAKAGKHIICEKPVAMNAAELEEIIADITGEMKTIFAREFQTIDQAFGQTFTELFGGGKATLELEDPEDILNCGIEIKVQPPGKALKIITLLSGGEKAFVAIALYFAILKVRPTPFVVMDEIEAALDDNNVARFAHYMRSMADKTQFIVITHRRGTMEEADILYGVTMQEQGVSRMLTINLNDVEKELKIR